MRLVIPAIVLAGALAPLAAHAHITVRPRQSELGAQEHYVVRTPNEKKVDTVRVVGVFPKGLQVTSLEAAAGWTIEAKRDASGAIVGATWTGSLPSDEDAEFGVLATNPASGAVLTWTFTQVYADGSKVEWAGPRGTPAPAPQVQLLPAGAAAR